MSIDTPKCLKFLAFFLQLALLPYLLHDLLCAHSQIGFSNLFQLSYFLKFYREFLHPFPKVRLYEKSYQTRYESGLFFKNCCFFYAKVASNRCPLQYTFLRMLTKVITMTVRPNKFLSILSISFVP